MSLVLVSFFLIGGGLLRKRTNVPEHVPPNPPLSTLLQLNHSMGHKRAKSFKEKSFEDCSTPCRENERSVLRRQNKNKNGNGNRNGNKNITTKKIRATTKTLDVFSTIWRNVCADCIYLHIYPVHIIFLLIFLFFFPTDKIQIYSFLFQDSTTRAGATVKCKFSSSPTVRCFAERAPSIDREGRCWAIRLERLPLRRSWPTPSIGSRTFESVDWKNKTNKNKNKRMWDKKTKQNIVEQD